MEARELTILVTPQEETTVLSHILPVLDHEWAKVMEISLDGTKRLVYTIKDHKYAGYINVVYLADDEAELEISKCLDKTPYVLRYLDVSVLDNDKVTNEFREKFYVKKGE